MGGHTSPVNSQYWRVGCLGITETCTAQCEESFLQCIAEKEAPVYAQDVLENFEDCIDEDTFKSLEGCTLDCAPTFNMMTQSEMPTDFKFETFGPNPNLSRDQPSESQCVFEN